MKYTFNTLEEVKTAIEKWFKDLGYDNAERAEKQYLKCIAELGKVSDEICKENTESLKLEIGDLGVTLIGLDLMEDYDINVNIELDYEFDIETCLFEIHSSLFNAKLNEAFDWYCNLIYSLKLDSLECLTLAYNKIQARLENGQLKVINGTIQK